MESVNVLVVSSVDKDSIKEIAGVSPRIKVTDATNLWNTADIVIDSNDALISNREFNNMLAEAEVMYGFRPPPNVIARAPKLKWFQTMFAGVDTVLTDEIKKSRLTITNMRGIHAVPVAEFTLGLLFVLAKKSEMSFQLKQQKQWERYTPIILHSKTVGIVGYGSIGKEVARLTKRIGMRVIVTYRTAKKGSHVKYADVVLPKEQLSDLLSQSDFVVLALPHTIETENLIGFRELKIMKPGAYIINVGRGTTINEEALIRALEESQIAGAALDAFVEEPLPASSKLWELPEVIITPHIGSRRADAQREVTRFFCENLKRYISGKRLLNVVNKSAGY